MRRVALMSGRSSMCLFRGEHGSLAPELVARRCGLASLRVREASSLTSEGSEMSAETKETAHGDSGADENLGETESLLKLAGRNVDAKKRRYADHVLDRFLKGHDTKISLKQREKHYKRHHKEKNEVRLARRRLWNIRAGDTVEVVVGKEKGKRGLVREILKEKNRIIVESVNVQEIEDWPKEAFEPQKITTEVSIHYSQVGLIDPTDNTACRIKLGWLEDGTRVRTSERTGTIIPWPAQESEERDTREFEGDTPPHLALKQTYFPEA